MAKEVQMSIKMERDLREAFLAAASQSHRPAAQLVREFMRDFVARSAPEQSPRPNAETLRAMEAVERGEVFAAKSVDDMFAQCGIKCEE